MLKSLYPKVNWDGIRTVGFDLDGTLFEELEFILQVYEPISALLAKTCLGDRKDIYSRMVKRWLEKGSSYQHIFEEILVSYRIKDDLHQKTIAECLNIYRHFKPKLHLAERVRFLLDIFAEHFELFLITDGSLYLQTAKFESLGLEKWFKKENVAISGKYGKGYEKPSPLIIEKIKVLCTDIRPQKVVFLGDRDVDREFAVNVGYQFIKVKLLYAEE